MKAKFPPARMLNLAMISGDAGVRRYRTEERGGGGAMNAFVLLNTLSAPERVGTRVSLAPPPPTRSFDEETQWARSLKSVSERADGNALILASGDRPARSLCEKVGHYFESQR